MNLIDQTTPNGKWEFDESVTEVFENMLERSIPDYKIMRDLCLKLGSKYVQSQTDIVDLGCSRGDALDPFINRFGAHNRFLGIEVSKPMLEISKKRFEGYIAPKIVQIIDCDLRKEFPPVAASLILSILTLQFIPIEYRSRIIGNVYKSLKPNGAFLLVEKTYEPNADLDDLFVSNYLDFKKQNGYTEDQIARKKLSLEGVLVSLTASGNEELLRAAGFTKISMFWRNINFAGWIAIK